MCLLKPCHGQFEMLMLNDPLVILYYDGCCCIETTRAGKIHLFGFDSFSILGYRFDKYCDF